MGAFSDGVFSTTTNPFGMIPTQMNSSFTPLPSALVVMMTGFQPAMLFHTKFSLLCGPRGNGHFFRWSFLHNDESDWYESFLASISCRNQTYWYVIIYRFCIFIDRTLHEENTHAPWIFLSPDQLEFSNINISAVCDSFGMIQHRSNPRLLLYLFLLWWWWLISNLSCYSIPNFLCSVALGEMGTFSDGVFSTTTHLFAMNLFGQASLFDNKQFDWWNAMVFYWFDTRKLP